MPERIGVCGLVESPLLTICSAEIRSLLASVMFMVFPFQWEESVSLIRVLVFL